MQVRAVAIALAFLFAAQPASAFDFEHLPLSTDGARSLVFAPDGKGIYIGDPDGNVRLWDFSTGEVSISVKTALPYGDTTSRNLVRVTADGKQALTAYKHGEVRYVDLTTGEEVWQVKFLFDELLSLALSPDGKFGVTSDRSTRLVLFRIEDGGIVWDMKHGVRVEDVAFSTSGELLFEAEDQQLKAETLEGYIADFDFDSDWTSFSDIDVAKSGVVAAAAYDEVHLYDGKTGKRLRVVEFESAISVDVAISPDGKRFLAELENGQAGLFDAKSGKQLGAVGIARESPDIEALAFSPDGSRFVVADDDGQISLWRTKGLKQIASARIWSDGYVVFLPDGAFVTETGWVGNSLINDGFDPSKADPAKVKAALAK